MKAEPEQLQLQYPPFSSVQHEETTLRETILKMKEYWAEIRRRWYIIILCCIPFLAWQLYKTYNTPVTYTASLNFMVDDEKSGGFSSISSVLGNFGLGGGKSNLDKVLSLSKSMRIIKSALFQRTVIDGKNDFYANHLIRIERLHDKKWAEPIKWLGGASLQDFSFTHDTSSVFTRQENAALKYLYEYLVGGEYVPAIFTSSMDKKSGIMTLNLATQSEVLSIDLVSRIYDELSAYYILSSIQKEQATYNILKQKSDSIQSLLSGTEYLAAKFKDRNNLLLTKTDQLPNERYARNKSLYSLMYGEVVKNLEFADFALKSETPYVQVIDRPIPPIRGIGYGKLKAIIFGLALGIFLGTGFVIVRFVIRQKLADEIV